ncbi:MAG: hypothetical protein UV82_C0011G0002 [Candidatus Magasanikbacteria bacterium GW2011_GWD2_43_18]|uniref:Uncharacterized protein n=1 Tax=Candidatus Magasanikbacteria bacterium GW2011_GWE2_42_7 TaxID=1619052 RepID=A0A0G1BDL2_9BACT|nr:MAG: hypothetical protein UV18_C0007G0003 [Candidatus Magasanikbacteria bacterium GW2011_GWC2_42_27]KKS71264.1 MAG: hypothetical protein UV42_C0033G0020 [Candidatus Magasanikbacteria bacterium GW2011_GWE2_42_7]KKT04074.1 MAG: hypothetical protein UV82_C0011G0002 [Candidatus Magasanikbacteria bacterium GW2011_GWD2_43_18]KKT24623.1 MAG: hypothetical protein UW10_C0022G0003 [Candidatus Magasanikbacteria bacterium GW2011_GWA2_43_9]HBB38564.1 hypothetical protein [Candidatus Magasanikbacteria bac
MTKYKIETDFIFQKTKKKLFSKKNHFITIKNNLKQNESYTIGIRIKNSGNNTLPQATIKNLKIRHLSIDLSHQEFEDYDMCINNLIPGKTEIIWYPMKFVTLMNGLIWLNAKIEPKNISEEQITTFQIDSIGQAKKYENNEIGSELYVISEVEKKQTITNSLLLLLTIVTTIQAVFGFKKVISWFFSLILFSLEKFLLAIQLIANLIK